MKLENATPMQIGLIVLLIIILVPPLLSLTAYFNVFNFSDKGQIGDTIGGVTAPFINGLSAILIFVAFKAQIEANKIMRDQDIERTIFEQIRMIQDNSHEYYDAVSFLVKSQDRLKSEITMEIANRMSTISFLMTELELAIEMVGKYTGDKTYLRKKLSYLYETKYRRDLKHLFKTTDRMIDLKEMHPDYVLIFLDFKAEFNKINGGMNTSITYIED